MDFVPPKPRRKNATYFLTQSVKDKIVLLSDFYDTTPSLLLESMTEQLYSQIEGKSKPTAKRAKNAN